MNEAYQHVVRMITQADLTHSNPAYPLLAALWVGIVIGLLRAIDARARYWLVVVAVGLSLAGNALTQAARLGLAGDVLITTPLPLLTAALAFALARPLPEAGRHAVAGAALGLHAIAVWGGSSTLPGLYLAAVVLAAPACVLWAGRRTGSWSIPRAGAVRLLGTMVIGPGRDRDGRSRPPAHHPVTDLLGRVCLRHHPLIRAPVALGRLVASTP